MTRFPSILVCCVLSLVTAQRGLSQSTRLAFPRSGSSREELLAFVSGAQSAANDRNVDQSNREETIQRVQRIQARLRDGDFHAGDHVALFVEGEQALTDTFPVRGGAVLELPMLGVVPLRGVLRSELESYLTTRVAQYIRNPSVRAAALVRIAVLGAVTRPGFYFARTDLSLSDVIMRAGGPTQSADVSLSFVKRGDVITWATEGIHSVLAEGMTLDDIEIQSGDEIVVGEQKHFNWSIVSQVVTAVVGAAVAMVALSK